MVEILTTDGDNSSANCIQNTCVPWWVFQPIYMNQSCCGNMTPHCKCTCGTNITGQGCDEGGCCPDYLHTALVPMVFR